MTQQPETTGYAYYDAMAKVEADFPSLSADVKHALAQYDADVATGNITFGANGHDDGPTHADEWLPERFGGKLGKVTKQHNPTPGPCEIPF